MTTQHTPGPWVYRYEPIYQYGRFETVSPVAAGTDPVVIAVREDWAGYLDATVRGQANARLIAAAPEEHAVLVAAVAWWHSVPAHFYAKEPDWLPAARAAIAKAEGRAP